MAAGSISWEEFVILAFNFIKLSEKTNDMWKMKELPVSLFERKSSDSLFYFI